MSFGIEAIWIYGSTGVLLLFNLAVSVPRVANSNGDFLASGLIARDRIWHWKIPSIKTPINTDIPTIIKIEINVESPNNNESEESDWVVSIGQDEYFPLFPRQISVVELKTEFGLIFERIE